MAVVVVIAMLRVGLQEVMQVVNDSGDQGICGSSVCCIKVDDTGVGG